MGAARALDPDGKVGSEKLLINLDYQHSLHQHWKMKTQYSLYRSNQRIEENILLFPKGAFYGAFPDGFIGNPETFEQNEILQSTFSYAGLNNHRITLGGGYRVEDLYRVEETKNFNPDFSPIGHIIDASGTPEVFMPQYKRDSYFVYIQDEYNIAANWEFTGGVRIDDYSDFGTTINPRLALVWSTNNDLTTKFLYGRAFRKPSFLQLNTVNNPISLGNPNVKPETIDTLEAVFNYQLTPHLHVSLNTYRFTLDKLIDFQSDVDAPTRTAQNGDKVNGYGVEAQVNYQPNGQLRFIGNYAYQSSTEQQTNFKQSNAPNQQWFGQLIWQISDALKLSTQITHVGKTRRNPFDTRPPLNAYTNVGFALNIEDVFASFDVQLKTDNLFNDNIRAPSPGPSADNPSVSVPGDYPQAGRSFTLSVSKLF
ncbi:MAG: TonB-dependent receptor [Psychrosphaera sp.]|nr:TonB-dependent receptor [Psychrosphaera sp.]